MTDSMGEIVWSSDYLPFGELINTEGKIENNFTFTGKEYDEATGLYYFGARYYDPKVGRFITKDPWSCTPEDERIINGALYPIIAQLIITEGLTIPQNIHPYMYCYNNPINYIDPYGYCGEEIAIGGLLIPPAKLLEITKAVRGPYITEYAKRLDALLKWAAKRAVMKATFIAADWIDPPILNEGEKELLEEWRKKYGSGSQKVE
ncbi:MAG: RHS repeat-associated core domain-containing protein, partial [bacterium]